MFSPDFADHAAGATDSDPDGPHRLSLYHARSRRGEVHLGQEVMDIYRVSLEGS